ncbi:hypothetical protein RHMOL_Rhmol03G0094100 [Rhododendron molle]|uniref:Uncharacterized protein n=1 Tax=Rhododendron molle TaxID=49168 RepID=A0ACC0PCH0_RHOML|nr:hypothetical protein RHMOL_Rhmol03G0094100 [Rhododendron molle]
MLLFTVGSKDRARYKDLANWSCAIGYGLGSGSPLSPSFNFGLELAKSSQFIASFYQHVVVQRRGKVGPLSSSVALAFKSWWKPSFTFNISATRDRAIGKTALGFGIRVDNVREASYQRADPNFVMLSADTKQGAFGRGHSVENWKETCASVRFKFWQF